MKPAPFQQSLKQEVKKTTTKHPFLPQIKQIWALVEKIQPSVGRRERGREMQREFPQMGTTVARSSVATPRDG